MELDPIVVARWYHVLRQLNLRTLHRCLLLFRPCYRSMCQNPIWSDLVVRDLGLVPRFAINMKLYYLRAMNFGVPLTEYEVDLRTKDRMVVLGSTEGVLMSLGEFIIKRGNLIVDRMDRTQVEALPWNVTIKKLTFDRNVDVVGLTHLLATDGCLYGFDGHRHNRPSLPRGEVMADHHYVLSCRRTLVLTKSGESTRGCRTIGRRYGECVKGQ